MRVVIIAGVLLLSMVARPLQAAHTAARLWLSATTARAGDTVWAGIDLAMAPGWHTYWKNPGDSGIATQIRWQLPAGVTAGDIQWPVPEKLPPADVTTYGYRGETLLLVPLTLASNLPPGQLPLSAKVSWLECQDQCVPGATNLTGTLAVGVARQDSPQVALLEAWRQRLPQSPEDWSLTAEWWPTTNADTRVVVLRGRYNGPPEAGATASRAIVDFYPDPAETYEVQSATVARPEAGWDFSFEKDVTKFSGAWPGTLPGVLATADGDHGYAVRLPVELSVPPAAVVASSAPSSAGSEPAGAAGGPGQTPASVPSLPLWRELLYALVGGLLLNLMPCVLPVIALKILGFVSEARSDPRRIRLLGLLYSAGVLGSFLGLALLVDGVKAAGHQAAWGMQFGSPVFLVCLSTLVTLVALNLFGVFEVALPGAAMDQAGSLASRHGPAGAFFNGVLATTLATPCTAPFLAPALGFAFARGGGEIVLVFLTVGVGLALPYLILSWEPSWLKFLPKPGAWMEKFKIAMGFPMLATVVWLMYIASASFGRAIAWLGGFLVVASFAAWIYGEFMQRGRRRRWLAGCLVIALLAMGFQLILEDELDWRHPPASRGGPPPVAAAPNAIHWQAWSPEAVTDGQAGGHPVLVDFTADWCVTCQVNLKTSIDVPVVRDKLKALHAVALSADYTAFPVRITEELQRFGRAGVPLVLVYPGRPGANPRILPEILTRSLVLDALDAVAPVQPALNKTP